MAEYTALKLDDRVVPHSECRIPAVIMKTFAIPASGVSNADTVAFWDFQVPGKVIDAGISIDATLGAGATLRLRRTGSATTNLTAASSAGSANDVAYTAQHPVDIVAGDTIECLVGGANVTAAANVEVYVLFVRD